MQCYLGEDIRSFAAQTSDFLQRYEAENNLMLGLINRLQTMQTEGAIFGYMTDAGEIVQVFLRTPGQRLILAKGGSTQRAHLHELATYIAAIDKEAAGVVGPKQLASLYAQEWSCVTKMDTSVHMEQLIYTLTKVEPYKRVNGKINQAQPRHADMLANWLTEFGEDANESISKERAEEMAARFIQQGVAYIWEFDDRPMAMACTSRRTANGITINAVYTPRQLRGRRLATNLVGALSQQCLDKGFRFCTLYTDQDNPASNRVYQRLGYQQAGESVAIDFIRK